jgi:hypothetical protein
MSNRRYPITFQLIDTMAEEGFPETDEELIYYLRKCNLVENPDKEDIVYFNTRVQEMLSEVPEATEEQTESKYSKFLESKEYGFGDSFNEFLKSMGSDELCLYLCDYDLSKTMQIYCTMDREDIMWAISEKIKKDTHSAKLLLESCVFGFGGKMGSTKDEGNVVDVTEAGSEGFNSLFSMG